MQGLMHKIILILFSLWLMNDTTFANKPKFSNQQIIAMTPGYFQKIKDGPQLLNATMYKHPQKGKVFQVEVRTNRNRENADLGASFDALLTLYKYFKRPPDLFVVVLHSDSRGTPLSSVQEMPIAPQIISFTTVFHTNNGTISASPSNVHSSLILIEK